MLVDAGAGWRYYRTAIGLETRVQDGTVVGFQELSAGDERIGHPVVYLHERDD